MSTDRFIDDLILEATVARFRFRMLVHAFTDAPEEAGRDFWSDLPLEGEELRSVVSAGLLGTLTHPDVEDLARQLLPHALENPRRGPLLQTFGAEGFEARSLLWALVVAWAVAGPEGAGGDA